MVHFSPIQENDSPSYWKRLVNSGMGHIQETGMMDSDISFKEAEQQLGKLVINGTKTPGHYFMHILSENNVVGSSGELKRLAIHGRKLSSSS